MENSQKNLKKILKIIKQHSNIISIKTGMRLAEKVRKKNLFRIPFLPDPG